MNTTTKQRDLVVWLFKPFVYIAGWQSFLIGLAVILAAGYIGSLSNAHFDGVLDTHTGISAPLWVFMSEGLIDWLSLSLILLVFGKIISKTPFRLLDLIGTQAMARWPTIITACVFLPKAVGRFALAITGKNPSGYTLNYTDAVIFAMAVLVTILVTCWFVMLMYRSYAISCNVKGGKAIGTFVAGLLIAEVLSKIIIVFLIGAGCTVGVKPFKVPTSSMEPTIKHGSHVVADTAYYTHNPVQRFDIVVVKAPDGKHKYIKRVIGLGNETVQIQGGKVIVNGQALKEPFNATPTTNAFGPLAVPAGQYFLLGDNRPNSLDSRNWEPPTVGQDAIVGKVAEVPIK